MRYKFLFVLMAVIIFSSCKKEQSIIPIDPPPPSPVDLPVVQTFLKDIVIPGLPSPYYHFEYDGSGKVSLASFASGFFIYNITYSENRIAEMTNNALGANDKLQYTYDNQGRATMVTYTNFTGEVYIKVHLTYEGNKLVKLERERRLGNVFIFNKRLTMSYYEDGNMKDITYYYPVTPINPTASTYTDHFEQYDDKINPDGFGLLHSEFFDHLILLPNIQLQKNNPGKETRTGDGMNYEVVYTYDYNSKNLPVSKNGDFTITSGPDAGQKTQTISQFSYY